MEAEDTGYGGASIEHFSICCETILGRQFDRESPADRASAMSLIEFQLRRVN